MRNTYKVVGCLLPLVVVGVLMLVILLLPSEMQFPFFFFISVASIAVALVGSALRIKSMPRNPPTNSTFKTTIKSLTTIALPLREIFDTIDRLFDLLINPVKTALSATTGLLSFVGAIVVQVIARIPPSIAGTAQTIGQYIQTSLKPIIRPVSDLIRPILTDRRNRNFLLGTGLFLAVNYLIFQREPVFPLGLDELQNTLRFDLPNLDNVLIAIVLLILTAYCAAIVLQPAPLKAHSAISIEERPSLLRFLRNHLPGLLLFMLFYVLLIARLISRDGAAYTVGLLAISLLILCWIGFAYDRKSKIRMGIGIKRQDLFLLTLIIIFGHVIGTFRLETIPNSVIWDEDPVLERAQVIADGNEQFSFYDNGRFEFPLASFFYQAGVLKLLGSSLWAWRFASLLVALLSVIPTYLLARDFFGRRIAAIAGILMVTMPHYLIFARQGYNVSQALLPMALAMYCLYLALQRKSVFYMIVSGIASGLSYYTFTAARLAFVVGFIFLFCVIVGAFILSARKKGLKSGFYRIGLPFVLSVIFGMSVVLTALPYLTYQSAVYPGNSDSRTLEVSIVNSQYGVEFFPAEELYRYYPPIHINRVTIFFRPDLYAILLTRGLFRTMLAFHMQLAPPHIFFVTSALPGSVGSIFYLIGLALVAVRIRRKEYLLLFLWFACSVLFLSTITSDPPRASHMIVIVPVVAIMMALGFDAFIRFLTDKIAGQKPILQAGLAGAVLVCIIMTGLYDYFINVPRYYRPDATNIMDFYDLQLESPRDVLYITSQPNEYDFTPPMTAVLPDKAQFQTIPLDKISGTLALQSGKFYTFFFAPGNADNVMDFLKQKINRNDIQQKSYEDKDGKVILISLEFRA